MEGTKKVYKTSTYRDGRISRMKAFLNSNKIRCNKLKENHAILDILIAKITSEKGTCSNERCSDEYEELVALIYAYIEGRFEIGWEIINNWTKANGRLEQDRWTSNLNLIKTGVVYSYRKKYCEINPGNREAQLELIICLRDMVEYSGELSLTILQELIDISETFKDYTLRTEFVKAYVSKYEKTCEESGKGLHLDIQSLCGSAFGHQIMYPLTWSALDCIEDKGTDGIRRILKEIVVIMSTEEEWIPSRLIEEMVVTEVFKNNNHKKSHEETDLDYYSESSLPGSSWSIYGEYLDRHTGPGFIWYLNELEERANRTRNKPIRIGLDTLNYAYGALDTHLERDFIVLHIKTGSYKGIDQTHRSFHMSEYAALISYIIAEYDVMVLGEDGVAMEMRRLCGERGIYCLEEENRKLNKDGYTREILEVSMILKARYYISSYSGNSQLAKLLRKPALLLGGPGRGVAYDPYIMQIALSMSDIRLGKGYSDNIGLYLSTTPGGSMELAAHSKPSENRGEMLIRAFELYKQRVDSWSKTSLYLSSTVGPFTVTGIETKKKLDALIKACYKVRIRDWVDLGV